MRLGFRNVEHLVDFSKLDAGNSHTEPLEPGPRKAFSTFTQAITAPRSSSFICAAKTIR